MMSRLTSWRRRTGEYWGWSCSIRRPSRSRSCTSSWWPAGLVDLLRTLARKGVLFFFSSRRRHTRFDCDWSSDVCSSDLVDKRIGIQINYAPVIDVNNNPANPVINDRSFGEDKHKVAMLGIQYMRGMQDVGVDRKSVV